MRRPTSPARRVTSVQGRLISLRGFVPSAPGNTDSAGARQTREQKRSLRTEDHGLPARLQKSASSSRPRCRSTSCQRRLSTSRKRQPVSIRKRMAAVASGATTIRQVFRLWGVLRGRLGPIDVVGNTNRFSFAERGTQPRKFFGAQKSLSGLLAELLDATCGVVVVRD